jgi:hypothetical protein
MRSYPALRNAVRFLAIKGATIPADLERDLFDLGIRLAVKSTFDLTSASAGYSQSLIDALNNYNSGDMGMVEARNDYIQAMAKAFDLVFDAGYQDGGGILPADSAATAWLSDREDAEMQNIKDLFFTLKQALKDNPTMDVGAWISDRSSGYMGTLNDIYSQAKVFGAGDQPLTFDGDDGKETCPDCQRMKGQTHPASWWIENNLVPVQGNKNYRCGGWNCHHGLKDSDGNWFTANPEIFG